MRFRSSEFDVPMPQSLINYWTAWNEPDLERLRHHLVDAVVDEVEWNDPRDSFRGIDALEDNMRSLKAAKPEYRFHIVSEMDGHHHRLRYRWNMVRKSRTLMEGLDVVTLDDTTGLITRVDGFFGDPTPLLETNSGVPLPLSHRAGAR